MKNEKATEKNQIAKTEEDGKRYKVIWQDFCGNVHEKKYKNVGISIKKCFSVYGWYKNGQVIRISDNKKIL